MVEIAGRSLELSRRAQEVIPGGVNSGNRSLPWPFAVDTARGAWITDADGKQYLDYHAAYGPIVLGHAHPNVNAAVRASIERVDLVGVGVTDLEVRVAETLCELVPSAEQALLTNSGSEATYAAVRLARAVTGRDHLVKFQGAYHGWHDAVLLNVISATNMIGKPDPGSEGMAREVVSNTLVLPFNDVGRLEAAFREAGESIAAVIVEVIQHNIGCVLPTNEFLNAARRLTSEYGSVLIFDEVVTGFRHGLGGYQAICGVTPDLTTLGKAIGNGFPIAALVGRRRFMGRFAPGGGVFFAGTFNGHPVGTAAALATIDELRDGRVYERAFALTEHAALGLEAIARECGIPITVARFGSVFVPYFLSGPITSYEDLLANDTDLDVWFRRSMCEAGIFMLPTALKRNHVSAAHTLENIEHTLDIARTVLRKAPRGATHQPGRSRRE